MQRASRSIDHRYIRMGNLPSLATFRSTVGCVASIDDIAFIGLVLVEVVATFDFVTRCRVLEVVHFRCDVH